MLISTPEKWDFSCNYCSNARWQGCRIKQPSQSAIVRSKYGKNLWNF